MNKLSCKDYKLLISRKVDNDLSKEELIDLNSHINKCPNCRLYENQMTSLKNFFRNIDGDCFFHFSHISPKRESTNFLKYASVVVASVFLFIMMFSIYLYVDKNNIITNNTYEYYSDNIDEYYPMSALLFYEDIDSNKDITNYGTTRDNIYANSSYFQYMIPVNY